MNKKQCILLSNILLDNIKNENNLQISFKELNKFAYNELSISDIRLIIKEMYNNQDSFSGKINDCSSFDGIGYKIDKIFIEDYKNYYLNNISTIEKEIYICEEIIDFCEKFNGNISLHFLNDATKKYNDINKNDLLEKLNYLNIDSYFLDLFLKRLINEKIIEYNKPFHMQHTFNWYELNKYNFELYKYKLIEKLENNNYSEIINELITNNINNMITNNENYNVNNSNIKNSIIGKDNKMQKSEKNILNKIYKFVLRIFCKK